MATECPKIDINLSQAAINIALSNQPDAASVPVELFLDLSCAPLVSVEVKPAQISVSVPQVSATPSSVTLASGVAQAIAVALEPTYINVDLPSEPNAALTPIDVVLQASTQAIDVEVKPTDVTIDLSANQGTPGEDGIDGIDGINAYTLSTANFVVPAIGSTAVVPVQNSEWIVTGQFLYVDSAGGGPGRPAALKVVAQAPGQITLENAPSSTPPSGGAGSVVVWGETPTGSVDGSNVVFSTANAYASGRLGVYLNGIRQRRPNDYSETGTQSFQFSSPPLSGDSVSVDYTLA